MSHSNLKFLFRTGAGKQDVVCPPEPVFANTAFELLLMIGVGVADAAEYGQFTQLLKSIGESEFYITENLGATVTDREVPYHTIINLEDSFATFKEKWEAFDPPFGWFINHFYLYGKSKDWGIYICEYPTINIIGCKRELSQGFREVFSIKGNGYAEIRDFVAQEFSIAPAHLETFENHYVLPEKR